MSRSSYRYEALSNKDEDEELVRKAIVELAQRYRRYGYRRVAALLRREGRTINHKRVFRLWRREGLSLPRRGQRKRRLEPKREVPTKAEYRGHVWTYDFVFDRTERNEALKILVVLDEYTRECHRIRAGRQLNSEAVIETLDELFTTHGAPRHLRSDNGGEFVAEKVKGWLARRGTETAYIDPGHPWENGYAESFNGKFRDECLNQEVFWSARHAQAVVERWRRYYNEERPHSALGYQTPSEKARSVQSAVEQPEMEPSGA